MVADVSNPPARTAAQGRAGSGEEADGGEYALDTM